MSESPQSMYEEGRLNDAVTAATARVKAAPKDRDSRGLLAELLCVQGELERADKQLEVLTNQDLDAAVGLALFRQLIRAERARQQFYADGRVPELLTTPSESLSKHLQASVMIRDGQLSDAEKLLGEAELVRVQRSGRCNDQPFDDFRDIDDFNACFIEVLTSNGKYYWVPIDSVKSIQFVAPARPRDLLWRQAELSVSDGPDGVVYVPAIYPAMARATQEKARLGRITEWLIEEDEPVRGVGQRTFLVGDEARSIMEITSLVFEGE